MKSPIFIFGSGRCGSTLIQRLLNSHASIQIYGEHQGFLAPLSNSFYLLKNGKQITTMLYGRRAVSPGSIEGGSVDARSDISWINKFNKSDLVPHFKRFLLELLASDINLRKIHWGFKEIRYDCNSRVLEFLSALFPRRHIIFPYRNPIDMTTSAFFAWHSTVVKSSRPAQERVINDILNNWYLRNKYFYEFSQNSHEVMFIPFEELISEPLMTCSRVFSQLNLKMPPNIEEVLSYNVNSTRPALKREEIRELVRARFMESPKEIRDLANCLGYQF